MWEQEQLGYIVWCGIRRANGTQGLRIIIQGDQHPQYLDSRIEAFLHKMGVSFWCCISLKYTCTSLQALSLTGLISCNMCMIFVAFCIHFTEIIIFLKSSYRVQ